MVTPSDQGKDHLKDCDGPDPPAPRGCRPGLRRSSPKRTAPLHGSSSRILSQRCGGTGGAVRVGHQLNRAISTGVQRQEAKPRAHVGNDPSPARHPVTGRRAVLRPGPVRRGTPWTVPRRPRSMKCKPCSVRRRPSSAPSGRAESVRSESWSVRRRSSGTWRILDSRFRCGRFRRHGCSGW